jgi:hypothetical protein
LVTSTVVGTDVVLGIKADVELLSVIVTFESLSPEVDIACSEVVKYFVPVMVCAIIITLYVYQTDGTKTWLFSLLKIKLLNVDISFGNVSKTNTNISTGNTSYSPHLSNIAKYLTTSESTFKSLIFKSENNQVFVPSV